MEKACGDAGLFLLASALQTAATVLQGTSEQGPFFGARLLAHRFVALQTRLEALRTDLHPKISAAIAIGEQHIISVALIGLYHALRRWTGADRGGDEFAHDDR